MILFFFTVVIVRFSTHAFLYTLSIFSQCLFFFPVFSISPYFIFFSFFSRVFLLLIRSVSLYFFFSPEVFECYKRGDIFVVLKPIPAERKICEI